MVVANTGWVYSNCKGRETCADVVADKEGKLLVLMQLVLVLLILLVLLFFLVPQDLIRHIVQNTIMMMTRGIPTPTYIPSPRCTDNDSMTKSTQNPFIGS